LEYNGVIYGAINVAVLKEYAIDAEEIALFAELAGDISFALFSIELETDRKRAEEKLKDYTEGLEVIVEERTQELRDAQESLVRQERLAVLGQLAGGVGHELRNPLGVISNAVYYLQTVNPDADESTQEYLNMISSEVQNAGKIISDLLDFSRTKMPERQEIGVSELVAQVLEKKPPPENVQVKKEFPEDLPEVYVDPAQINQVLSNLVENAYQAMLEGGKLVIKGENKNNQVLISINDNGIGISPENMKKLFEPLFTTKAKGIGLGLAVSRTLLETNGGTIEVESEEGRGSTFTVILPGKV
jgi:signal transduction histidine kinase